MSLVQIAVLSVIVGVFAVFGLTLGGVSWYCRGSRDDAARRRRHAATRAPAGHDFAWDD